MTDVESGLGIWSGLIIVEAWANTSRTLVSIVGFDDLGNYLLSVFRLFANLASSGM
jgi:hypothetical protein